MGTVFLTGAALTAFILFRQGNKGFDRIPAQFSQQELQYAEVLWGDSESETSENTETEDSLPGVQPQWAEEGEAESPYNYSLDPLAEDLHKQTQEEYHSRLFEEWKRQKERTAKKAEERAVSSQTEQREPEQLSTAGEHGASPDENPRESRNP